MDELRERVLRSLRELGVADDDPIGVACSGGADSVALVHLLAGRPRVTVLHVDHNARDGSSDDAAFVRETARALGSSSAATGVLIDITPDGFEAAAREARYDALEAMAREHGLRFVLTAHTMDDQAETVLLRLMRGGSLGGIAPVRGVFVRPLLGVRRSELRDWLVARGIAWHEDPTNQDTAHDRNWVRHVLLPQLHDRRPGVAKVLARTAARTHDDDRLVDAFALDVLAAAESDDVGVLVRDAAELPPALITRVARHVCRDLGSDPTEHDIDAVRTITTHARCGGVDVWRLDDGLAFVRDPFPVPDAVTVPPSGELTDDAWGIRLRIARSDDHLYVRSRRPGDRVAVPAGHRKIQDVLVDAKVPRPLRPLVPILADDQGALAVIGGHTQRLHSGTIELSADPFHQTWSRELAWIR